MTQNSRFKVLATRGTRNQCGWQRQKGNADVYIIPHNLLAYARAPFLLPACALIVDESPINALMVGMDGPQRSISLFDLSKTRDVPSTKGGKRIDYADTADLENARSRITKVLENLGPDESLLTAKIVEAGLSAADTALARTLTFRCMGRLDIAPDMNPDTRKHTVERAKENQRLLQEAKFWELISRALDKDLDFVPGISVEIDEKGPKQFEVVRLRWSHEIHEDWQVPTLLMDATANWEMYRRFWPNIDREAVFDAAMPQVKVRQIKWSASKAKLIGGGSTQDNNCKRILHYIEARSIEFDRLLIICQLSLEEELQRLGLPDNTATGHFNGTRGIDKYKDVDCLIVIGRPQAPPDQAEIRSEVLFDCRPERGSEWEGSYYPRREVGLCVQDQTVRPTVEMEYHPDSNVETVRWSICEAELIQSIGRGRGVNRTADNPLQIDIIGTVPLPIEINEVLTWEEAQADPFKLMEARGVVLDCDRSTKGFWNVVAAVLPDRFKDIQAAKDWGRTLTVESANRVYLISKSHCEGLIPASMRLKGSRYKLRVLIDPRREDPREFLETVVGPVDFFETAEPKPNRTIDIGLPPDDSAQSIDAAFPQPHNKNCGT